MIFTAAFSASPDAAAAWLAGALLGLLSLLAGLRWGGRRPARVTVPVRIRDGRRRADRRR
jgi:hypothetical protein